MVQQGLLLQEARKERNQDRRTTWDGCGKEPFVKMLE